MNHWEVMSQATKQSQHDGITAFIQIKRLNLETLIFPQISLENMASVETMNIDIY